MTSGSHGISSDGNFTKDTEGCVLLGLDVSSAKTDNGTTCAISKSKEAFWALQAAMQKGSDKRSVQPSPSDQGYASKLMHVLRHGRAVGVAESRQYRFLNRVRCC
jgi:hypothetical protein